MSRETGITEPRIIRWRPGVGPRLLLEVDTAHNGGHGINRRHDVPQSTVNGKNLTDTQLLAAVCDRHADEEPLAFVGNGNLKANPGFVASQGAELYHRADEPVFGQGYPSIVSWQGGRVTVEDVWYAQGYDRRVKVLRKVNGAVQDITDAIEFTTSGQPLVRMGEAIPLPHIAEKWYDTRHAVRPICVNINGTTLFVPNAQLQQGLLRMALCQPISMRLEAQVDEETVIPLTTSGWLRMAKEKPAALAKAAAFLKKYGVVQGAENPEEPGVLLRMAETTEHLFMEALQGADYSLVDDNRPLQRGEMRFINGHLGVFMKENLYPQNFFVTWPEPDGSCGFVVFPGKSGQQGTTLSYAQEFLTKELKVQSAIGLDNGGDVRLWYRGQYLVASSEGREEIRSILVLTTPKDAWCGDAVVVF